MPELGRIVIYPLKSFDPLELETALILPNGALQYDRQFALIDVTGRVLNAKRTARVHGVSARLDPVSRVLTVRDRRGGTDRTWDVDRDRTALEAWFSAVFEIGLSLHESADGGFPDDTEAAGPTVVSTATLETVAGWFPGLTVDQVRLRFRANLEIAGVEPFWEDRLYGASAGETVPFRIGQVTLSGTNPCQRCAVPTRDPETGAVWPEFAREFSTRRSLELPPWAARSRFNHFYRLTVNTCRLSSADDKLPASIRRGDVVEVLPVAPPIPLNET